LGQQRKSKKEKKKKRHKVSQRVGVGSIKTQQTGIFSEAPVPEVGENLNLS
jgi:hypothetical protein